MQTAAQAATDFLCLGLVARRLQHNEQSSEEAGGQWVTAADVLREEEDYCWKENAASSLDSNRCSVPPYDDVRCFLWIVYHLGQSGALASSSV